MRPVETHAPIARNETAVTRAALDAPQLQGFAGWLRFGAFTTRQAGNGYQVWIRDVRYSRSATGIGSVRVDLNSNAEPVAVVFDADE